MAALIILKFIFYNLLKQLEFVLRKWYTIKIIFQMQALKIALKAYCKVSMLLRYMPNVDLD